MGDKRMAWSGIGRGSGPAVVRSRRDRVSALILERIDKGAWWMGTKLRGQRD